eukprot:m.458079 g.458079  ORF g.458079 m.458079 type:complete len:92 (-) comp21419_c0_seq1:53-328(-)
MLKLEREETTLLFAVGDLISPELLKSETAVHIAAGHAALPDLPWFLSLPSSPSGDTTRDAEVALHQEQKGCGPQEECRGCQGSLVENQRRP